MSVTQHSDSGGTGAAETPAKGSHGHLSVVADLHFRLLGPLEARRGRTPLELGPPKRRALLLRLLLENGRPVSAERLCEDLGHGRPPSSAMSSIHAHICRLRAVLEPQRPRMKGARVLRSTPLGYALEVPEEARDSVVFEKALHRAHGLAARGRAAEARQEVEHALGLWRGAPLSDVGECGFAEQETARLTELRLSGEELLTGLVLRAGETARAVASAEALVERDPLRETSWVLLMRALYFAGRPAEALARFETVRALLEENLGLEPSPALRDAQAAVLRHRVADLDPPTPRQPLTRPRAGGSVEGTENTAPPVGRDAELALLTEALGVAAAGRPAWAVVSGGSGSGKTRLARETAERARANGFAVRWIRCVQGDRPVVGPVAGDAGDPARGDRPVTPEPDPGGRPLLYVVDDVGHADEALLRALRRSVLTAHDGPLAVVCTVGDRPALEVEKLLAELARQGAARVQLAPLDHAAARHALLLDAAGRPSQRPSPAEVRDVLRRSGGVPFLLDELLKLPPAVRSVFRVRLAALPADSLAVLEAVAAFDDACDVRMAARVAGSCPEDFLRHADRAVEEGLLLWSPALRHSTSAPAGSLPDCCGRPCGRAAARRCGSCCTRQWRTPAATRAPVGTLPSPGAAEPTRAAVSGRHGQLVRPEGPDQRHGGGTVGRGPDREDLVHTHGVALEPQGRGRHVQPPHPGPPLPDQPHRLASVRPPGHAGSPRSAPATPPDRAPRTRPLPAATPSNPRVPARRRERRSGR
jgi:DNA-binding SARP family transcriptional activator